MEKKKQKRDFQPSGTVRVEKRARTSPIQVTARNRWVFTINNYTPEPEDIQRPESVSKTFECFIKYGKEVGKEGSQEK